LLLLLLQVDHLALQRIDAGELLEEQAAASGRSATQAARQAFLNVPWCIPQKVVGTGDGCFFGMNQSM
jgi:hypothetical protein